MDNPFVTPTSGQADWDASLTADILAIDRGFHVTERAGTAISTGQILWLNSGGFFFPFNPNSESIRPHAMAYTAAASGDSLTAVAWGIVRSLSINSPSVPGKTLYVSALTPGLIVTSYAACNRPIGRGLAGYGVLFNPGVDLFPEQITSSIAIAAVTGSLHLFSASAGRFGWNRQTALVAASANLVELKWYSDAARTKLLYATISGGVSAVGSYQDRAGWPWENTDASTLGDLVYGSLKVMSAAGVGSDTVSVQQIWDRHR